MGSDDSRHNLFQQLTDDGVQCDWSVVTGGTFAAFFINLLYDDSFLMSMKLCFSAYAINLLFFYPLIFTVKC